MVAQDTCEALRWRPCDPGLRLVPAPQGITATALPGDAGYLIWRRGRRLIWLRTGSRVSWYERRDDSRQLEFAFRDPGGLDA